MDLYEFIDKGRIKRYLSARNRIIYPGGIYHVTHRAPGKERIFVEKGDYLRMLSLIKETSKEFSWKVFSFVLMPNHFHILLKITEPNLSMAMKKLCERYAKYFNTKYERKGPVFSRPYRAALCLDEVYLLSVSIYIHLNPCKAGICKDINRYRWSSFDLYMRKRDSFVDANFILKMLNNNADKARKEYLQLLYRSMKIRYRNTIEQPSYMDYFKNKLRRFLTKSIAKDEIEDKVDVFRNKKRLRNPQDIAARRYLVEQLLARGYKIKEIAVKLNTTRRTIHSIINFKF